ncbi:NADH-quinone oxidoreductase subunit A [Pseudonocardia xinjiangensis]|uniref:NADH-quinone oxidoreductase subunit A n=1 Tax=Pseudonocardia xinjiangensis TaxID=75289 RepID=UPI003D8C9350
MTVEEAGVSEFWPVLVLLGAVVAGVVLTYGVARVLAVRRTALEVAPFTGGLPPAQHAFSRFHVRWYPVTMVFLAFDMEMVFMYPWTLVVSRVGPAAVIEMFAFLAILLAGVVYAWREGALRWT